MTALVVLAVDASPASAHTVSGQSASNFRSTLTGTTPQVPGLSVRVVELGSQLEVTWTGQDDLVVTGYRQEPYLRIGPDGIFRNRRSTATYLNATRAGGQVPPDADDNAPPDWVRIGSGRTVRWHDHRIHWMGGRLPPTVRRDPGSAHRIVDWKVDMLEAGRTITAAGTLEWAPASSALPWILLIVVLAVAGIVAGLSRRWAEVLLALTAVLVAADVVHAVGTGLAFAGTLGHRMALILGGSYYSVVAWVLGGVAIWLLARRSVDGLFAAVFTALVIGLFGGLADVVSLSRSQIPFSFGAGTARLLVAISIGGSIGVIVGSILAFRRNRPPVVSDVDGRGVPSSPDLGAAGAGS